MAPIEIDSKDLRARITAVLDRVAEGEEFVILRDGKPVARLVRAERSRIPGDYKGKIWISEDFDAPLPADMLALFEGPIEPREPPSGSPAA